MSKTVIELTGKQFGCWKVTNRRLGSEWFCHCKCGTKKWVSSTGLRSGKSSSCGCDMARRVGNATRKHGASSSFDYWLWGRMKARCQNKNNSDYRNYGARGIAVCKRWQKFENFAKDMLPRPRGTTLDRINNDKGYSKHNCRWATRKEQAANRRTPINARPLTFNGRTLTIRAWARELNVDHSLILRRIDRGFSIEAALFTKPWQQPNVGRTHRLGRS